MGLNISDCEVNFLTTQHCILLCLSLSFNLADTSSMLLTDKTGGDFLIERN